MSSRKYRYLKIVLLCYWIYLNRNNISCLQLTVYVVWTKKERVTMATKKRVAFSTQSRDCFLNLCRCWYLNLKIKPIFHLYWKIIQMICETHWLLYELWDISCKMMTLWCGFACECSALVSFESLNLFLILFPWKPFFLNKLKQWKWDLPMFGQKMKFTRRSKEYSTGILHIVAGFPSLFVQMFNLTRDIVYRLCIFSLCFNCLQTIRTTKDNVFIIFQLKENLCWVWK